MYFRNFLLNTIIIGGPVSPISPAFQLIEVPDSLLTQGHKGSIFYSALEAQITAPQATVWTTLSIVTSQQIMNSLTCRILFESFRQIHGLRTPDEEIAFTARLKIKSESQIYRYGRSIFCLPHRPKFSDFLELYLHWVSVVRAT